MFTLKGMKKKQAASPRRVLAAKRGEDGLASGWPKKWQEPSSRAAWVVITLLAFAVYGRTLGFAFLNWDDNTHLSENPAFRPATWQGLWTVWGNFSTKLYIPMSYFTWNLLALASQGLTATLSPVIFHLANIFLHASNAALVFMILRRCLSARASLWSLLGALLFLLHPLQIESVAWISGLRDLLSASLMLLAIYLAISSEGGWGRFFIVNLIYLLSLLAKPSSVIGPLLFVVLIWAQNELRWREIWQALSARRRLTLLVWCVLALLVSLLTHHQQATAQFTGELAQWWQRPVIALDALGFYLQKLFLPVSLAVDYGRTPSWLMGQGAAKVALWSLAPLAALAVILGHLRWRKIFAAPLSIFLLSLAPVLGLIDFTFMYAYSSVADHYMYVALLGPAWLVASHAPRTLWPVVAGLGALLALNLGQQSPWRDSVSLFEHTVSVNARSNTALENLGTIYWRAHEPARAIKYYQQAAEVNPRSANAQLNLGLYYSQNGQGELAQKYFQRAVELAPKLALVRESFGRFLLNKNNLVEAERELAAGLELAPSVGAYLGLGQIYALRGENEKAFAQWRAALRIDPNQPEANYKLGFASLSQGRWDELLSHWRLAAQAGFALDELSARVAELAPLAPQQAQSLGELISQKSQFKNVVHLRAWAKALNASQQRDRARAILQQAQLLAQQTNNVEQTQAIKRELASLGAQP